MRLFATVKQSEKQLRQLRKWRRQLERAGKDDKVKEATERMDRVYTRFNTRFREVMFD